MLLGWPYDIHTYAEVSPLPAAAAGPPGDRPVPVLAVDTVALIDAVGIEKAVIGDADWGAADGRRRRGALVGAVRRARFG